MHAVYHRHISPYVIKKLEVNYISQFRLTTQMPLGGGRGGSYWLSVIYEYTKNALTQVTQPAKLTKFAGIPIPEQALYHQVLG